MAQTADAKLLQLAREMVSSINDDEQCHEAMKQLLAAAPIVARGLARALTPIRAMSLMSALGTMLLQRGDK